MKQNNNDELRAHEDVQALFNIPANAVKISTIPDLVNGKKELDERIAFIKVNKAIADADTTGIRGNKLHLRALVVSETLDLAGPLVNLGRKNNDDELIKKFNFTKTELGRKTDNDLLTAAGITAEAADTNILDLASAGVTPAMVTALQDDHGALTLIILSPEAAKQAKKVANKNIKDTFPLIRELMQLTMNPLMRTNFAKSDPDFYQLFLTSTQIISTGRHHLDFFGLIVDKQTGDHLHGAIVQVMVSDKLIAKAKSAKKGHFRFKVIPEGTYTVVISLPGYLTQTVSDIVIIKGVSTKKTFLLNQTPGKPVIN